MPASLNNTAFQLYGTNTANRVPAVNTLEPRELFVNTYNSYHAQTVSIVNGGSNFTNADVGKVATLTLAGAAQLSPIRVGIDAVANGAITMINLVEYGAFSSIPGVTSGTILVPGSTGTGATIMAVFAANPSIEAGGGLFVGDATQAGEYVKLTGSLAAQDHNAVNIVGGDISNTTLANVMIIGNDLAPTTINGGVVVDSTITGGTINGATLVNVTLGTAQSPIPNAYITNWHTSLRPFPQGVTGAGVLVLGSDGIVYATANVTCASLTTTGNVKVGGALGVGPNINNVTLGSIRAQNDVTAFAAS